MTETEKHYAQIDKEALVVTWSCEKFSCYILGHPFLVETDHKPLVPLLSTNNLDNLPLHVLRFWLRLAHYDYCIWHVPGKLLYITDALSRPSLTVVELLDLQEEVESFMCWTAYQPVWTGWKPSNELNPAIQSAIDLKSIAC